jgi:hypothetical protein
MIRPVTEFGGETYNLANDPEYADLMTAITRLTEKKSTDYPSASKYG